MQKKTRTRARPLVRDDFDDHDPTSRMSVIVDPVKTSTPYLITLVARLQTSLFERRAAASGTSFAATHLLHELGFGAALSHSELSRRLNISHATVAQTVKWLEREGLIERSLYAPDRRQVRVRLTTKGAEVRKPLQDVGQALIAEISGVLGEETEAIVQQALIRLADHFQPKA